MSSPLPSLGFSGCLSSSLYPHPTSLPPSYRPGSLLFTLVHSLVHPLCEAPPCMFTMFTPPAHTPTYARSRWRIRPALRERVNLVNSPVPASRSGSTRGCTCSPSRGNTSLSVISSARSVAAPRTSCDLVVTRSDVTNVTSSTLDSLSRVVYNGGIKRSTPPPSERHTVSTMQDSTAATEAPAIEPAYITQARAVLDQGFFCDLNENAQTPIDAQTANVMVMAWEACSADQKSRLLAAPHVDVWRFATFAWKVTK